MFSTLVGVVFVGAYSLGAKYTWADQASRPVIVAGGLSTACILVCLAFGVHP